MATLKQIRRRIRSVQSTQQITKAMEMVAAAKLKRAQDRVVAARPYARKIQAMLESLSSAAQSLSHPLFDVRPVEKRALIVIASDKGLCGSYNMNVFRAAEKHAAEVTGGEFDPASFGPEGGAPPPGTVLLIPVGRRANLYFRKRHWEIDYAVPELGDQSDLMTARDLAAEVMRLFISGEVDLVEVVYTHFISTMSRRVVVERLLPVAPETAGNEGGGRDYIFEPSPEAIFDVLLPRYVESRVLQAFSESLASEHSSRMVSMGSATKNAKEVIDHLTLVRNRLRQAAITREISEIVGGAEAIK